jgi:metal-responsive CopG/Arc/MetJ family transcriptional regulator
MGKKIKTGKIIIPEENFEDKNITAHISIRLPLSTVKDLKRLALNEEYEGRYQVLIKDILQSYISKNKSKKTVKIA